MPIPLLTTEMSQILKKLVVLTRAGQLPWETTASSDVLVTPLGGEYSARLEQTADFDGDPTEHDHVLTVSKGRKVLFALTRRDFEQDVPGFQVAFRDVLADSGDYPYKLFYELWQRANFKGSKLADDLEFLNKLLDTKVRGGA